MSNRTRIYVLAISLLGTTGPISSQDRAPQNDSIRTTDLASDVSFLASDNMRGRLTGTPENRLAAEFIRSRFQQLDLKPVGDDGHLMQFGLIVPTLGDTETNALQLRDGKSNAAPPLLGKDFFPERFSDTGSARGSVVFVGFGISAPALDHDDYGDADVSGKMVLMLDHEPGEFDAASPFDGIAMSEHGRLVRKVAEAQRRGAAAVLIVADVHNHETGPGLSDQMRSTWPVASRRVPRYELAAWTETIRIPAVRITSELAARIVSGTGTNLEVFAQRADKPTGFTAVPLDVEVEVTTVVERHYVTEHNVVGLLEGSDATLRNEWIIVCAHFDHEGASGARIFNGADDDASGVAGLLEIAEAYALAAQNGTRPRRSILFAAWNAEERGLFGSWAYTEQPLAPLSDTVALINMDMIGRNEEVPPDAGRRFRGLPAQTSASNRNAVNLLGYSYSTDMRRAADTANTAIGLTLRFRYDNNRSNLLRRSDHWPFLTRGVPALFVHSGLHPDYHTERDQADKLNYQKMMRIVKLVHQLSWDLAQHDGRPTLN